MSLKHRLAERVLGASMTESLRSALDRLRGERRIARAHRAGCALARNYAGRTGLRLHLGCGGVHKPGWVNIDTYSIPPCAPDLTLDLRRPLPFADDSCAEIYSEHVFEHIPFPGSALHLLGESRRLLPPGGLLSIGVPDPRPVLQAWLDGTHDPYFDYFDHHPSVQRHLDTRMEAVNWLFRQGGEHQFIYDCHSLKKMLLLAGFTDISRREFDPSIDSEARRHGTLYVTARRP